MKIINRLKINKDDSIFFLIPEVEEKYNYFYRPTELLHINDQITIILQQGLSRTELAKDMLGTIYEYFLDNLQNTIDNKITLEKKLEIGRVGYAFNMCIENENDDDCDLYFPNCLFNNSFRRTWLYAQNDKIYIEVSPLYPWLYEDPQPEQKYISFGMYMKSYKFIALYEINKNQVKEWITQCSSTLQSVNRFT